MCILAHFLDLSTIFINYVVIFVGKYTNRNITSMSTQQQIDQYNAVIALLQEQRAEQERILGAQQIQLARDEKFLNDIVRTSLDLTRPDLARLAAEEIPFARQRVSDTKIAIATTQNNIKTLDADIAFNTSQRNLVQAELLAQPRSAIEQGGEAEARIEPLAAAPIAAPLPVSASLSAAEDVEGTAPNNFGVWDNGAGRFIETGLTEQQAAAAAGDPFEALRLQSLAEFEQDFPAVGTTPAPVLPSLSVSPDPDTQTFRIWDNTAGVFLPGDFATAALAQQELELRLAAVQNPGPVGPQPSNRAGVFEPDADAQAAILEQAREQAALNERRRQANQGDWRVKLKLAPNATYLYNDPSSGILAPLSSNGGTDGVIFPYTPKIDLSYRAMYDTASLTHSNYSSYFYKNSMLDPVNITATFTAQDTAEANYLLAVIHFFRSVTKMFYGQDSQRGAPPPLVFFTGLGEYQFAEHPCVVHQFNYSLPSDVDYIRARSIMDPGTNLQNRRLQTAVATTPLDYALKRLQSIGQKVGAVTPPPAPPTLGQNRPTYVPTRIDISLILYPIQSRSQVSKQFSLKQYANGDLLKGGFW